MLSKACLWGVNDFLDGRRCYGTFESYGRYKGAACLGKQRGVCACLCVFRKHEEFCVCTCERASEMVRAGNNQCLFYCSLFLAADQEEPGTFPARWHVLGLGRWDCSGMSVLNSILKQKALERSQRIYMVLLGIKRGSPLHILDVTLNLFTGNGRFG